MLELELIRLKRSLKLNDDLELCWLPNGGRGGLSGEVKNRIVFVYDAEYDKALRTLRHEVVDYLVSHAIEPYKLIANKLILLWNEEAYKTKEDLVERLCNLQDGTDD